MSRRLVSAQDSFLIAPAWCSRSVLCGGAEMRLLQAAAAEASLKNPPGTELIFLVLRDCCKKQGSESETSAGR